MLRYRNARKETEMSWYVTFYPNSWGKGRTPEESRHHAQNNWGGEGTAWVTKKLPEGSEDPWVDGFGTVRWDWKNGKAPEDYDPSAPLEVVAHGKGYREE
jgi:hypothetical protein